MLRPGAVARMDHPEAWLRTVTPNLLRSRMRRAAAGSTSCRSWSRPRRAPEVSADRVLLVSALAQLPREQREAIALHHVGDLPIREIALTIGSGGNHQGTAQPWPRAALGADPG